MFSEARLLGSSANMPINHWKINISSGLDLSYWVKILNKQQKILTKQMAYHTWEAVTHPSSSRTTQIWGSSMSREEVVFFGGGVEYFLPSSGPVPGPSLPGLPVQ